jgi:hypothetical protein
VESISDFWVQISDNFCLSEMRTLVLFYEFYIQGFTSLLERWGGGGGGLGDNDNVCVLSKRINFINRF